jgi:hypothetical protein
VQIEFQNGHSKFDGRQSAPIRRMKSSVPRLSVFQSAIHQRSCGAKDPEAQPPMGLKIPGAIFNAGICTARFIKEH